jgi:hypothetical protein
MGKMKEVYTQMQEIGLDPNNPVHVSQFLRNVFQGGVLPDSVATTPEISGGLSGEVLENVRNNDVNKDFNEAVQQKFQHAKHMLLSKHKDYGPKNIAHSPGGPLNGLRVRMWDKFARINNLIDNKAKPENESLRDSFLDMANYAIIAMLVLDGEWPNE